jgi:hypothetical protein
MNKPTVETTSSGMTATDLCAAVKAGTMTKQAALAMLPKPEPMTLTWAGYGPVARPFSMD